MINRTALIFAGQFGLVALLAGAVGYWYYFYRLKGYQLARYVDIALGTSFTSLIVGRLFFIGLEWEYFSTYPTDMPKIWYAGFDWHGLMLGGMVGLWFFSRWRDLAFALAADGMALIAPVLVIGGWAACRHGGCALGARPPADAPPPAWMIGFLPDTFGDVVLRYELQVLGAMLSLLLFLMMTVLCYYDIAKGKRLWIMLALQSLSMFVIGFGRAKDTPEWQGIARHQWLDIGLLVLAMFMILLPKQRRVESSLK